MADGAMKNDNGARRPAPRSNLERTPEPGMSRQMLILLMIMLAAMWFWKSNSEGTAPPPVPYSQLYQWISEGKIAMVVLDGEFVDATLKNPETVAGRQIKDVRISVP